MAELIIRLRTRAGTKRLLFGQPAAKTTWKDLQLQVQDVLNIPVKDQLISLTPVHNPTFIEAKESATLASLGLEHGAQLYLKEADVAPGPPPAFMAQDYQKQQQMQRELQKNCSHGPRGRCLNCDNVRHDLLAGKKEGDGVSNRRLCNHPPGAVCIHCSAHIAAASAASADGSGDGSGAPKDAPAAWMCNHPDSAFCPKCLPPEEKDENMQAVKPKTCQCDNRRSEWCTECIDLDKEGDSIKHDLQPWAKIVEEHARLCQYKHPADQICFRCAPPDMPNYAGKPECDAGHKPWPRGTCLKCAPANVVIRAQQYRHTDTVSVPPQVVQQFYVKWRQMDPQAKTQRAAILFGRYEAEPGIKGGVRAVVHAAYEPPQMFVRGSLRFTKDPQELVVENTARLLGLEAVGWMVTTVPRGGDKYHGKVFLSGSEVRAAARLQHRYSTAESGGRSRFVTVVIEHGDVVTPAAYQVSDQCVAMQRDGILDSAEDPLMVGTYKPKAGELAPKIVYRNEVIPNGSDILTDDFVVKVILSAQVGDAGLVCRHFDFPSESLQLGREEGLRQLKDILNKYSREDWIGKLSDFLLLCFLPQVVSDELHQALCEAYRVGQRPSPAVLSDLDAAMIPFAY